MAKLIQVNLEIDPRTGNVRLAPADALSEDMMRELPRGARLNANVTVSRNTREDEHMGTLRFYMAGINLLFENVDGAGPGGQWPTARHLRHHILRELGFYTAIPQANGAIRKEVESMALDKMELSDLKTCLELSRAFCEGEFSFDPWQVWADQHPMEGKR